MKTKHRSISFVKGSVKTISGYIVEFSEIKVLEIKNYGKNTLPIVTMDEKGHIIPQEVYKAGPLGEFAILCKYPSSMFDVAINENSTETYQLAVTIGFSIMLGGFPFDMDITVMVTISPSGVIFEYYKKELQITGITVADEETSIIPYSGNGWSEV